MRCPFYSTCEFKEEYSAYCCPPDGEGFTSDEKKFWEGCETYRLLSDKNPIKKNLKKRRGLFE